MSGIFEALDSRGSTDAVIEAIRSAAPERLRANLDGIDTGRAAEIRVLEERANAASATPADFLCYATHIEALGAGCDYDAALGAYGRLLAALPEDAISYLYAGAMLRSRGVMRPSGLLLHRGLGKASESGDEPNVVYPHRQIHEELFFLGHDAIEAGKPLKDMGYPVDKLGFEFDGNRRIYIPRKAEGESSEVDWTVGDSEAFLCDDVHYPLADIPHNANSCPYLAHARSSGITE